MVKLDAMENPYGLPAELAQELGRVVSQASLNRYPDPAARALKARLRQAMAVPDDMGILLGNGSDELIQVLALAVNKPGAVLLGVEPSFVMFRMVATFVGLRYVGVPLPQISASICPRWKRRYASTAPRSFSSPIRITRPATCLTQPRSSASSSCRRAW